MLISRVAIKKYFVIVLILLLPSLVFGKTQSEKKTVLTRQLNGKWKSKFLEPWDDGLWVEQIIEIKLPHFYLETIGFESSKSKAPFLEHVFEGSASVTQNPFNGKVINLNLNVSKDTILVKKMVPQVERLNIENCAPLNVPVSVLTKGCGTFSAVAATKKLFYIFMLLDPNTILFGTSLKTPTTKELRPYALNIFPLVRKP